MDAKAAAKYLGCSKTTFDNYRYNSSPKLTGYRVGGKTLFKREDIDSWVKLYEIRSKGLA
jgi:excisionase family DNA binding protein